MARLLQYGRQAVVAVILLAPTTILPDETAKPQELEAPGVCQALARHRQLDGKMIAIHGLYGSNHEAEWLASPRPCSSSGPSRDLTKAIAVTSAGDDDRANKYHTKLQLDKSPTTTSAVAGLRKCAQAHQDADIILYGRFEGYPRFAAAGKTYGYGANDEFPAQLVVTKVIRFFGCVAPDSN